MAQAFEVPRGVGVAPDPDTIWVGGVAPDPDTIWVVGVAPDPDTIWVVGVAPDPDMGAIFCGASL